MKMLRIYIFVWISTRVPEFAVFYEIKDLVLKGCHVVV